MQQQQQVLGTVGQVIPGSSNSIFKGDSSSHDVGESTTAEAKPAPRVDPNRVEAQLVLPVLQRAMSENAAPFLDCLDNQNCRPALTGYLIRLQKQAMGTLDLPPTYDRYDLKRGKE